MRAGENSLKLMLNLEINVLKAYFPSSEKFVLASTTPCNKIIGTKQK